MSFSHVDKKFKGFEDEDCIPVFDSCELLSPVPWMPKKCEFTEFELDILGQVPKTTLGDFEIYELLGSGQFGQVFLAAKTSRPMKGTFYALKVLSKFRSLKAGPKSKKVPNKLVQREKKILKKLDHPFIVKCDFIFQSTTSLFFVLEFAAGGDLAGLLEREVVFTEGQAQFYLAEIAAALVHLHSLDIIHRDLKPANVLLTKDGHVKLSDFGLSRHVDYGTRAHTICGTFEYLAPEVVARAGYGPAADWWSFGIMAYEMLHSQTPFYAKSPMIIISRILRCEKEPPKFSSSVEPNAKDFIQLILRRSEDERLGGGPDGFFNIMNHNFFNPIFRSFLNVDGLKTIPAPFTFEDSSFDVTNTMVTNFGADQLQNPEDDPFKDFDFCSDAMKKEIISAHMQTFQKNSLS